MNRQFDMSRFIDLFIEEAQETLKNIETLLLEIEHKNGVTPEEINDLFRFLHTLKGNSSSIGFTHFSKLAHELENLLDAMRHDKVKYSRNVVESLIDGYELLSEAMRGEIDATITEDFLKVKCLPLFDALKSIHSGLLASEVTPKLEGEGVSFGFFDEASPLQKNEEKEIDIHPKEFHSLSPSIRINLEKIDTLMNGIGELVIAMSMLEQYTQSIEDKKIKNGFEERIEYLRHTIRELQDSVMSTRMVPMEQVYGKFPKLIRDIGKKLGKEILYVTAGDDVEIDKAMTEGLSDPLMHIIRNACDHGIETPSERIRQGKKAEGTIKIEAAQANERITVTIADDGKGMDTAKLVEKALEIGIISAERAALLSEQEKFSLIFEPGFSTASDISDISGRGVGMDVARSNINRLGGSIQIESTPGKGTIMRLSFPLTLAIVDVLTVMVGKNHFFLPLSSIIESLQPTPEMIQSLGNHNNEMLILREEAIAIVRLHDIFHLKTEISALSEGILIIARYGASKVALFVDMFLNQQQVVIKPIDKHFKAIEGFGGASIKGDGSIALILDVVSITAMHKRSKGLT